MRRKLTTAEFIERAKKVHGDKYDYSKTCFKNIKEKLIVTCPEHGDFEITPDNHIRNRGCKPCSHLSTGKKKTRPESDFLLKILEKHGEKLTYVSGTYKGMNRDVSFICEKHGVIKNTGVAFLTSKYGCMLCGSEQKHITKRSKFEDVVTRAKEKFKDSFEYECSDYKNMRESIVKIKCKKHGSFDSTMYQHLRNKHGCPECGKRNGHGFRLENWVAVAEKNNYTAKLYLLKIDNSFYKIGITLRDISERVKVSKIKHEFSVIAIKSGDPEHIYKKEAELKDLIKPFAYTPNIKFSGHTECFSELTQEVKDFFGI